MSDLSESKAWLPLFDRCEVDLVVNGHDHDYERSYPVRGFAAGLGTSTFAGGTVTNASGVHVLPSTKGNPVNTFTPNVASTDLAGALRYIEGHRLPRPGRRGTNKRDNAYGIALFEIDPGERGGNTTITVTYYHAPTQTEGTTDYSVLENFQLTRARRDVPAPDSNSVGFGRRLATTCGRGRGPEPAWYWRRPTLRLCGKMRACHASRPRSRSWRMRRLPCK
jgi:hypothetical protein